METISSRKNQIIAHLKALANDGAYREKTRQYVCDGEKLLREALDAGALVTLVLWAEKPAFALPESIAQYCCPEGLMQFVSPLKNSKGPVFAVVMPENDGGAPAEKPEGVLVLEGVQDPGNVGTVIRTAAAMGISAVVLVGGCADLYNPKTVRATMGAIFRQTVLEMNLDELKDYVNQNGLNLYGAALSESAQDIRKLEMKHTAVAVGSEGRGLSQALLALCSGQLIIPMSPGSESLNAAVAAAIIMWEMVR